MRSIFEIRAMLKGTQGRIDVVRNNIHANTAGDRQRDGLIELDNQILELNVLSAERDMLMWVLGE